MDYMRYRDFIANLETTAEDDDTMRLLENELLAEKMDTWLCLKPGRDGGVVLARTYRGKSPSVIGAVFKLEPTVMLTALSAALAKPEMMEHGRRILTPGALDPVGVGLFSVGLQNLATNPYQTPTETTARPFPVKRPPSLAPDLWRRIPHEQRREYIVAMAMALRRGVHPDNTVETLLAA